MKSKFLFVTCQKKRNNSTQMEHIRPPSLVFMQGHCVIGVNIFDLPSGSQRHFQTGGQRKDGQECCDAHDAAMFVLYFQLAANHNASGDAADPSEHVLAHLHHSRGIIYKNKLPFYCLLQEWEEVKQRDGVG